MSGLNVQYDKKFANFDKKSVNFVFPSFISDEESQKLETRETGLPCPLEPTPAILSGSHMPLAGLGGDGFSVCALDGMGSMSRFIDVTALSSNGYSDTFLK